MMRQYILAACLAITAQVAHASDLVVQTAVQDHILPSYSRLAVASKGLEQAAADACDPKSARLRDAFHDAFDAWTSVSHLRFGPSEQSDRAFALAFWPDPRSSTPKSLAALIRDEDPVIDTSQGFSTLSIAARGFYALEFLLFDEAFVSGTSDYSCRYIRAATTDIATNAHAILSDWTDSYAEVISSAPNATYQTELEAKQQLFTALTTGLEFTANARLGRPMGTFERPRPKRAEARRSGRSLEHVVLSLEANKELAMALSDNNADIAAAFDHALDLADKLDDPVFAGVATPQGRFRVEALKQSIEDIRTILAEQLGPQLGVAAGFNSLDGD